MKYKYFLLLVAEIFLFSCTGTKRETVKEVETDPRVDTSMLRTKQDTLTLDSLATTYLNYLKNKDFNSALDMLFELSEDSIAPLSEMSRKAQEVLYKNFPVTDYKLNELFLYSETDTELRYTVTLFEKEENDDRPNTMKFQLTPERINNNWKLLVKGRAVNR